MIPGRRLVRLNDSYNRLVLEPFAHVTFIAAGALCQLAGCRGARGQSFVQTQPAAEVDREQIDRTHQRFEHPLHELTRLFLNRLLPNGLTHGGPSFFSGLTSEACGIWGPKGWGRLPISWLVNRLRRAAGRGPRAALPPPPRACRPQRR